MLCSCQFVSLITLKYIMWDFGLNNNKVGFPLSLILKISFEHVTELDNVANHAFTVFGAFID